MEQDLGIRIYTVKPVCICTDTDVPVPCNRKTVYRHIIQSGYIEIKCDFSDSVVYTRYF